MDILRKELNAVYAAQRLCAATLDPARVEDARLLAQMIVRADGACAVVTDASCDRCYIYSGVLGRLLGLTDGPSLAKVFESSDEDEIYSRIHPEDLVGKRLLEYAFFKNVALRPDDGKCHVRAACRIRMMDRNGRYRYIDNTTRILTLSPDGGIWLILCCYELSPLQSPQPDISPRIVDCLTGDVTSLEFDESRRRILSEREKEILRLIRDGRPSKQIADILGISIHTVNRHRQNIISKLSVGNSVEAVAAADAMRLL